MNNIEARIQAVAELMRGKHLDEIQSESVYLMGVADKALSDRITAFGAIRRAAEVARGVENTDIFWTPFGIRKNPPCVERANEIRRAIRAAIGSDKA